MPTIAQTSQHDPVYPELLRKLIAGLSILPDKNEETCENTLAALWHKAKGGNYSAVKAGETPLTPLDESEISELHHLIERRIAGEPLAHLTGRQNFLGIELEVEKEIYIPRKETELLGKVVLDLLNTEFSGMKTTVMDLCTGVGTLAIAAAYYNKSTTVHGSDINPKAITLATRNARRHNLEPRTNFYLGSLYTPYALSGLEETVNVICSAPPYISTKKIETLPDEIKNYEPLTAFKAGAFGLDIFNGIIKDAHLYLQKGGYLVLEVGLGQGGFLAKRIRSNSHFSRVESVCDEHNDVRVLIVQK